MATFDLDQRIERPRSDVFRTFADPSMGPEFMPNILRVEKLTEGPTAVGSRFSETRVVQGKESSTELEVVELEQDATFGVRASAEGINIEYRYTFADDGPATHVHMRCTVTSTGLKRAMTPLVAMVMKREDGAHLEQIRSFLEADR